MKTIEQKITTKLIELRKARNPLARSLSTLKGEIDTKKTGNASGKEITDSDVIAIITRFVKGLDETSKANGYAVDAALEAEKALYQSFLPEQMTPEQIKAFAQPMVDAGENFGVIMKALREAHANEYSGKDAATIIKEMI